MRCTRLFLGKSITWKLGRATNCLYLIHIPVKLHEDVMKSEGAMECTRIKNTQSKRKLNQKGYNSETKSNRNCTRHIVLT